MFERASAERHLIVYQMLSAFGADSGRSTNPVAKNRRSTGLRGEGCGRAQMGSLGRAVASARSQREPRLFGCTSGPSRAAVSVRQWSDRKALGDFDERQIPILRNGLACPLHQPGALSTAAAWQGSVPASGRDAPRSGRDAPACRDQDRSGALRAIDTPP